MSRIDSLRIPLTLWFATTLFFAFQFILRMSAGILREDIMQKFSIDTIAFGNLAGYYYLGYASMQIPIGILLDRFNFRVITCCAIMIAALGTLTFVFATDFSSVIFGRFLIGAGSATGILSIAKIIQQYFPTKLHSIMMGLTFSFGLTGAVFGGLPMRIIFDSFGYEDSFMALAFVAFVIGFLVLLISDKKANKNHECNGSKTSIDDLLKLILNPTILFIGICGGLMVGSLEGFADLWSIPFFNQIYNFSENQSIVLSSIIFIGMIFGGPLLAYLEHYFRSINFFIFILSIVTSVIFVIFFYFNNLSYYVVAVLMFLIGVLCCYQALVFTLVGDLVDKSKTAVAIAVINCINMSFGQIFHKSISYIMHLVWNGNVTPKGGPLYLQSDYVVGLSIIPTLSIVGGLGFLYLAFKKKSQLSKEIKR